MNEVKPFSEEYPLIKDMLGQGVEIGDEIAMPGRSSNSCWIQIYLVRGLGAKELTVELLESNRFGARLGRIRTLTAAHRTCLITKKAKWRTNASIER